MEVKVTCGCGTRFAFDVEPVEGRMPYAIQCPNCHGDATAAANQVIVQNLVAAIQQSAGVPITSVAPPPPLPSGLQVAVPAAPPVSYQPAAAPETGGLLHRTTFFVKERAGLLKFSDTYDILDPASGCPIGIAKEEQPIWVTLLRFAVEKSKLPTVINIYEAEGQPPVLSIRRGFTFLRQKIRVQTGDKQSLGYFKSKLLTIGGGLTVYDNHDQQVAEVKGNWKGWDFRFVNGSGQEIGTVTKKWAGLAKELFTSADNYVIALTDTRNVNPAASALLLAAGLAIDIVYKESE